MYILTVYTANDMEMYVYSGKKIHILKVVLILIFIKIKNHSESGN